MLDALMQRIDKLYPNSSGAIINKLSAAKNMIVALDPDLLKDEVVPMPPPKPKPEPETRPETKPAARKKSRRK